MNRKAAIIFEWVLTIFFVLGGSGCESDIDAAYNDFRDNVPSVCKDYCEEKTVCEHPTGTGELESEVFAQQIHFCEVECGTYAVEGAYAWYADPYGQYDRVYFNHLSGDAVMDAFLCLYGIGAYRCIDKGTEYAHEFNPPARNICEAANDCIAPFGVNMSYSWNTNSSGLGGSCSTNGSEFIEAQFF